MRLAVFTSQFPTQVSTFFARDMRALLQAGIEVDVFSILPEQKGSWRHVPRILDEHVLPRDRVHYQDFLAGLWSVRPWPLPKFVSFLRDVADVGLSAVSFGLEPLAKSVYVMPKAWAWAQRYWMAYDHVLAYWGNYAATCAFLFHRLSGRRIPLSIFLHAGTDLYRNQVYLKEKLLYADNIIVVCKFNERFIRDLWPDIYSAISPKIFVHHIGLDLTEFPYVSDGRLPGKIVAVGRLDRAKGFDYLIRAVRELDERGLVVNLEFIGDGTERNSLRRLANALGIEDRIRFRGWLSTEEVRSAIQRASILVHPSSGLGDAVPTVIKEAMALGTPVVASRVAGIPELLDQGRCGVLIPPRDARAIADAIQELLTDPEKGRLYSEAARKRAEAMFDMWANGQSLAALLWDSRRSAGGSGFKLVDSLT